MPRPYQFSSMKPLVCFEAAARFISFKEAARELNVTPAAISHQIKALETELGQILFHRHHRGVELTEAGAFLFVALQRGFEGISDAMAQLRVRQENVDVVIRTSSAISSLWLTPKVAAFWRSHPQIAVSQMVNDTVQSNRAWDLSLHYGQPPADGGDYITLFSDRIVALGSPAFAAEHGLEMPQDLFLVPLIHLETEDMDSVGWSEWFAELGFSVHPPRRFVVNNYLVALRAAQDDVGAVLGWDGLVGDLIEEGRLVRLVPESIPSSMSIYLQVNPRATAQARLFRDWLVANV